MEREVSIVTEIGVTLIALSAVIGIIWFTIFMGNMMGNDVSVEASEIVSNIEVGALNDLCDTDTALPTSAVYSILRTYSNYIPYFKNNLQEGSIKIQDLNKESPNILKNLKGKVSLEVTKTDEGWYEVEVHHVNCNWFNDSTLKRADNVKCAGCIEAENAILGNP